MAFERTFLLNSDNAPELVYAAYLQRGDYKANGASSSNLDWQNGVLVAGVRETMNIEGQRGAQDMIAGGLAVGGEPSYVLKGLKAFEWGLLTNVVGATDTPDVMGIGNWPLLRLGDPGNNTHPRSVFIMAACRAFAMVKQSNNATPEMKAMAKALSVRLRIAAEWMLNSADLVDFLIEKQTANQRFFVATSFFMIGLEFKRNAALMNMGWELIDDMTNRMWADGVLPEDGDFDVSYQSLSLELLASFIGAVIDAGMTPDPVHVEMLNRGTTRWLAAFNLATPNALVIETGSRTSVHHYTNDYTLKSPDLAQYAQRCRYIHQILPRADLLVMAAALAYSGPDFRHI